MKEELTRIDPGDIFSLSKEEVTSCEMFGRYGNKIPKHSGVYGIEVEGKYYIGGSVNVLSRLANQISTLRCGNNSNKQLQKAYNVKGVMHPYLLKIVHDESQIVHNENYYIGLYDAINEGYNKTLACKGSMSYYGLNRNNEI